MDCPRCRKALRDVLYLTAHEADLKHGGEARCEVNRQRFLRDQRLLHPDQPFFAIPVQVMMDDSLPD